MLTSTDIQRLLKAFQGVFYTKEEMDQKFAGIDEKFSQLQTSVDKFAKTTNKNEQEIKAGGNRIDVLEECATRVANKLNLPYKA